MNEYMAGHNSELHRYHLNKDDATSTRGSKRYASAEKEAKAWHESYGGFD